MKDIAYDFGQIFKSTVPGEGVGINLLQCEVAIAPTVSGRPPGSYGWCGLPNMWYAIDDATGKGYMFASQFLPFADPQLMDLKDDFEKLVWSTIREPDHRDFDKELGATQLNLGAL